MLRPNPGGIMGTDGLLTTTATMERDLQTLSQQQLLRLMPSLGGTDLTGTMATLLMATATTERGQRMLNPGGMETMDTTATLLMAMATMERDLLMPSLLQMLRPNPGGMDTMATLLMAMAISRVAV